MTSVDLFVIWVFDSDIRYSSDRDRIVDEL